MADTGFFKGTSADQDRRFSDKEKKLLKSMKFPPEFDQKVDLRKVNLSLIKPWIAKKVTELVGFEDDIVIDYAVGLLENTSESLDPRKMQINLTGFLTNDTQIFMTALWRLLLEAQQDVTGIPRSFVEEKKQELRRARESDNRVPTVDVAEGEQGTMDTLTVEEVVLHAGIHRHPNVILDLHRLAGVQGHVQALLLGKEGITIHPLLHPVLHRGITGDVRGHLPRLPVVEILPHRKEKALGDLLLRTDFLLGDRFLLHQTEKALGGHLLQTDFLGDHFLPHQTGFLGDLLLPHQADFQVLGGDPTAPAAALAVAADLALPELKIKGQAKQSKPTARSRWDIGGPDGDADDDGGDDYRNEGEGAMQSKLALEKRESELKEKALRNKVVKSRSSNRDQV